MDSDSRSAEAAGSALERQACALREEAQKEEDCYQPEIVRRESRS